jgi:hypothetical protein
MLRGLNLRTHLSGIASVAYSTLKIRRSFGGGIFLNSKEKLKFSREKNINWQVKFDGWRKSAPTDRVMLAPPGYV